MKRWLTTGLVWCSMLFSPGACVYGAPIGGEAEATHDPRLRRIKAYFKRKSAPLEQYAADLVAAADLYRLDWRLLPSLAMVESSGGKVYANNNVFGWDSCKQKFPSIQAGIHTVAERLANSPYYRGKSLDGKLRTYNRNPRYATTVKRVMAQLAAEPLL